MALLTTEDVLNKTFANVKFREGYDQVEVDEFLDEVVSTIFALNVENQDLKDKLEAAKRRIAELSSAAEAMPYVEPAPVPAEPEEPVPAVEEPVVAAPQVFEPLATEPESAQSATSMLALAQRVHDEYVRDGKEESERIIAEARQKGDEIIADAQNQHETILAQLDQQRGLLETKLNELRTFESEYRTNLRTHLEGLLSQVNAGVEE